MFAMPPPAAAVSVHADLNRHVDPAVTQVVDRRCSGRKGARNCRNREPQRTSKAIQDGYGYAYGAPKAEFYPTGTTSWWQAMEREGRTGHSPD